MSNGWNAEIRGPKMSGDTGNRIWKYQIPVKEEFSVDLPEGAQIIRFANEGGLLYLWAVVDTSAPIKPVFIEAFKAGGTMPDDLHRHRYLGMAPIYIQAELMLYYFEVTE